MSLKKTVNPLDVYKFLPRTNCKVCGEETCMAFATRLAAHTIDLEKCTPIFEHENRELLERLEELILPPVREVIIGTGEKAKRIGGKVVMYRHDLTYHNPTPIAVDVTDDMSGDDLAKRVKAVEGFSYTYIGRELRLDAVAVRGVTGDPRKFEKAVETVTTNTELPLILCSFDPNVMESGLMAAKDRRPLIYAATRDNWKEMAELAMMHECPVAAFAPNDLSTLRSITSTVASAKIEQIALDPGTFCGDGLRDTVNNFTALRQTAFLGDENVGYPLIGVPMAVWAQRPTDEEPMVTAWKESYIASMLMVRYADLLIMHSLEPWVMLPLVILRFNLYTDPRKPVATEPGLRAIGTPDQNSPVLFTSNFALTETLVKSDIESANIDCYLLVVDADGVNVQSAVAGLTLTADKVAELMKETGIERKVGHRAIISPGYAARLRGELEDLSGWRVLVGPIDSSGLERFLEKNWPPKEEEDA